MIIAYVWKAKKVREVREMHRSIASEDQMSLRHIHFTAYPVGQSLDGPMKRVLHAHLHLDLRP